MQVAQVKLALALGQVGQGRGNRLVFERSRKAPARVTATKAVPVCLPSVSM